MIPLRAATPLRALGLALLAGAVVIAVLVYRDARRNERMRGIADAQRELARTHLAPPGAAPQAGVSARGNIDVREFPPRLAARLHEDPDFHRLVHRCGVCHSTPDPSLHSPAEWPGVIERMSRTIDAAGLLPLSPADSVAVLRVLTNAHR